jgi:hypothetical protein
LLKSNGTFEELSYIDSVDKVRKEGREGGREGGRDGRSGAERVLGFWVR